MKVLIWDTIFTFPTGDGTAILVPREHLAICKAKAIPSFLLSYFTTLSVGPVPGIDATTSGSAIKRFTNCMS